MKTERNWNGILAIVMLIALALAVLYETFVTPVKYEATKYEIDGMYAVTMQVTYQGKNIYGMDVGEEFESTELTNYAKSVYGLR